MPTEALYDAGRHREKDWIELERSDFNGDGDEEVILKNPETVLLFSRRGGTLLEMDYRPKAFNILSTLTRREEGYHQKLLEARGEASNKEAAGPKTKTIHEIFDSKESDLDRYLHFDKDRRASFLDHFIVDPVDLESYLRGQYQEAGDFTQKLYELDVRREGEGREVFFSHLGRLRREGRGSLQGGEKLFHPNPWSCSKGGLSGDQWE